MGQLKGSELSEVSTMSDDNSMDVDDPKATLLPSLMPSPPLSPGMDEFRKRMIDDSKQRHWSDRITEAGSNKAHLRFLFTYALTVCGTVASSVTALNENFNILSALDIFKLVESLNDDEIEEWKNIVQKGDWVGMITHPKYPKPAKVIVNPRTRQNREDIQSTVAQLIRLTTDSFLKDFKQEFIGDFATEFINHIKQADLIDEKLEDIPLYAKAISVVQSSGTGKSRMLTEVGKQIFTLPICLRKDNDPGYPLGDKPVVKYISTLTTSNDLSLTAHIGIASFIAAAHEMMLETLQKAHDEKGLNGQELLEHWNGLMEPIAASIGVRDSREEFFKKVVERANILQKKMDSIDGAPNNGPNRGKDGNGSLPLDPFTMARNYYKQHTEEATKNLMEFLSEVLPGKMSIMYFDEAQGMGSLYRVFLRLVQHQSPLTKMWYTFMGTESRLFEYAPLPRDMHSARLKGQFAQILPPYIDLGFDQQVIAIAKNEAEVTIRMRDMETVKFISQYGRPMYADVAWNYSCSFHYQVECMPCTAEVKENDLISMASFKLRNGERFDVKNKNHVFAVLSQRLCLDLVLTDSEAIKLADRSVAHHMRLLAANCDGFNTHSPSEPVLVMGSIIILYNEPGRLREVLNTFSQSLCAAGLVEKGMWGELCARTLLVIARDFAAPRHPSLDGRNYLKPVCLMDFLHTLFGRDIFDPSNKMKFDNAFGKAYVNFTHWISTRDPITQEPNQDMLANLWVRGAGLQCCFSHERIDLLVPAYYGSIGPDSIFDPSLLSVIVMQIKSKHDGDLSAELAISPLGVDRDLDEPLPYLAILMELGCEQSFKGSKKKIKYMASGTLAAGEFRERCKAWNTAEQVLLNNTEKAAINGLKKKVYDARLYADSYNRYSISVRGASPEVYGILHSANIVKEFGTLLNVVRPSSDVEKRTTMHMRPSERMSRGSPHTDWMWKIGLSGKLWKPM